MKFRTVILKCKVDEIVHVRERLDEIAAVTEGKIWFETILQSESGTYAIVCHYPDSNLDMFADYIKNKNELHIKNSKLEKVIEALTGRPADEIVKNYNICDNGFGVNYRRREKSILGELAELKKENEELKKLLKSAEQSDCIAPLRDMIDTCEEKIDEHTDTLNTIEADLDDFKKRYFNDKQELQESLDKDFDDVYTEFSSVKDTVNDINMGYIKWSSEVSQFDERIEDLEKDVKLLWNNAFNGLEKRIDLFDKIREDHEKELKKDIDDIHNWINAHDRMLRAQSGQNVTINNSLTDLNIRLKAIEKRLSIKPFYAPTEDEKDD